MSQSRLAAAAGRAPARSLRAVYVACFAFGVQAGTGIPLVPLALEHRGIDKFTIGIVGASWGIGMLATAHRIPAIAARVGAVPLICLCAALNAAISVVYAYTVDTVLWFALGLLSGALGSVPWVVSEIWINLVTDERRRGRVVAVYSTLVALGLAAGPLVLQTVGVYGPKPFLANAALAILVILPFLSAWNLAPAIQPTKSGGFGQVLVTAPVALMASLASGLGEQVAFSFLPVYAVSTGVPADTGALWLSAFVIGNIVLQWPIGWMADHADRRMVLAVCALASAALAGVTPLLDPHDATILFVLVAWGGISFGIYTVGLALLGRRFLGGDIARANAAFTMMYTLGGLIGRPIAGEAMDLVGGLGMGGTAAFFYAAAGTGALLAMRRAD